MPNHQIRMTTESPLTKPQEPNAPSRRRLYGLRFWHWTFFGPSDLGALKNPNWVGQPFLRAEPVEALSAIDGHSCPSNLPREIVRSLRTRMFAKRQTRLRRAQPGEMSAPPKPSYSKVSIADFRMNAFHSAIGNRQSAIAAPRSDYD